MTGKTATKTVVKTADEKEITKAVTKKEITKMLIDSGFSPYYKGFRYIRDALLMIQENPKLLFGSLTKVVYPTLAEKFGETSGGVERAIRTCLKEVCKSEKFKAAFGDYMINLPPTNREFLAVVYEIFITMEE